MQKNFTSKQSAAKRLIFLGLTLIIAVIGATFLALQQLQDTNKNLDTRRQAMIIDGSAELSTYPFANTLFKVGETSNLDLQIDAKEKSVDAVELFFEISADEGVFATDDIRFSELNDDEISISSEIIQEENKFVASVLISSENLATGFSTHEQMKTIARLELKPQKEGSFKIKILEESTVLDHSDGSDILDNPGLLEFSYSVSQNGIDPAQCYYVYSAWSECENFWQSRDYQVAPTNCRWHEQEDLEELSRQCSLSDGRGGIVANPKYFYLYTFEKCWNYANRGDDLHILWNSDEYEDVTWVDVSASPNFDSFYHKNTSDSYSLDDFRVLNASGFTGATDDVAGQTLSFQPDQNYYFRLWDNEEDQHISSVRFYTTYCSGDQSDYLNCNASCGENSVDPSKACAAGLTCYQGNCRLENNPENEICLDQAGISLLNKDCNQYCADTSECASNLTCYWNHCRLPSDLSDSQCQSDGNSTSSAVGSPISNTAATTVLKNYQLPSEAYDLQTYACNQGCNNNRDCQADYRCYQGQCRLASNPESISCDAGEIIVAETESDATKSALPIKPSTTPSPTPTGSQEKSERAFFENVQAIFLNLVSKFNWQWLALAGLILIVAIALIIVGISQGRMTAKVKKAALKEEFKQKTENSMATGKTGTTEIEPVKTVKIPENKATEL